MRGAPPKRKPAAPRSGLEHITRKNRRKKVERFKELNKYKALLKREGHAKPDVGRLAAEAAQAEAEAVDAGPIDGHDTSGVLEPAQVVATQEGESENGVPQKGKSNPSARQKFNAQKWARKEWEAKEQQQQAAKQEAQRLAAEREAAREDARKRRRAESAKLNKRTRKGQPILGNQVEHILRKLERSAQ